MSLKKGLWQISTNSPFRFTGLDISAGIPKIVSFEAKTDMTFDDTLARYGLSKQNLLVWAFIPFREDGFFDEGYDAALTERELGLAFSELGVDWRWQPVTLATMQDAVQRVCDESGDRRPLVMNYCDGDEVNGYPGVSVVHFLTEAGIPYSGADARFYDISTSKVRMKHLFREAGVPSPDFRVINDPERDTVDLCERLGTPLIVKPSVSAGSRGLSSASVISSNEAAGKLYRRLKQGLHDLDFSCSEVYAERYVNGPEYTVLVVGSHLFPENKRVYPPMERVPNGFYPTSGTGKTFQRKRRCRPARNYT